MLPLLMKREIIIQYPSSGADNSFSFVSASEKHFRFCFLLDYILLYFIY